MIKLQYAAGVGRQSDVWSERHDFPNGIPTYNDEWRLVATELAEDYHERRGGHEVEWPVNIRIYKDDECVWSGDVIREMEPSFYVI